MNKVATWYKEKEARVKNGGVSFLFVGFAKFEAPFVNLWDKSEFKILPSEKILKVI